MKKFILYFFVFAVCAACAKKNKSPLVGTWKLTHTLIDIGNGKATFEKANQEKVIEFFADGTLKSNTSYCPLVKDTSVGKSGTYNVDQTILIIPWTSTTSKINFELTCGGRSINWPTAYQPILFFASPYMRFSPGA